MNVEKNCVVCGMGSSRDDWQGAANPSCDSHSKAEVDAAVAALNKTKKGNATPKTLPTPAPASTEPTQ